ncbi:hypothetical protein DV735_g2769, partial [Chaetothyriales sp. CBS 134920]
MELSRAVPRSLAGRLARAPAQQRRTTALAALGCSHLTTGNWRQFSSNSRQAFAGPQVLGLGGVGGSGGGQPSYFQKSQSLPANTIIRFVPQQTAWIVERMGKFNRILSPGLAILIPVLDRIAYVQSLKESAIEIPSQSAITADNVTLDLDGVLYTRVVDAYKASYGVEDAEYAISQLAQTTMRSEIGQLTLDHVLKERANLNSNITQAINEASQAWGVVCLRYEIRDIHAPDGVVAAMHRQVTAERSKRAEILDSEGQRQSAINIAEGRKQSVILASEALKAEQINQASGEAEAILLKAAATARGIEAVAKALRDGELNAQQAVSLSVAEKYVDAFGRLAKEGTAVVVPGNVGDMASMITTALAVYGRVNAGQQQALAHAASGASSSHSNENVVDQVIEAATKGTSEDVAKTVLEGDRKNYEVYSCHVSPDGQRLVTSAADGYVRIWSTEAIYNAANPKYDKAKQLASMSVHSGTIHTVRFSPGGKFLASGADDKYVCIYTLDPKPPKHTTFGSNEAPPVEHWPVFRRLVGHDNDVQDLAWSYDGTVLVSVGLDSKIVVWSGYTFEKLKTLSSHSSHVKGITFDPANKYFATASDDRTVRIFKFSSPTQNYTAHDAVNNFVLETSISAPFVNSPLTTYFRRCSWSPDGQLIAAANAVNGPVSAITIINRGQWDGDTTLIGHEGPVEVCAFAPRLYGSKPADRPVPEGQPLPPTTTVVACGGADKCLSIWTTSSPRPLIVQQDVALKPLADLAWSPDGMTLFAVALDGTILTVMFEPGELGYPRPIEENDRALTKFGTTRRGQGFPETTDALLLEEMSKAGESKAAQGRMGALMGDGPPSQTNGSSSPAINGTATTANGTANSRSGAATPNASASQAAATEQAKLEKMKSRIEITKDGKKRIRPLLVSTTGVSESNLPQARLVHAASSTQAEDAPHTVLDLSKPFESLPPGGIKSLLLGNKRKYSQIEGEDEASAEKRISAIQAKGATPILVNGADGLSLAQQQRPVAGQQETPDFIRPAVVNPVLSVSQLRLAVPKVRSLIVLGVGSDRRPVNVSSESKSGAELVLEVRNPSAQSLTNRAQDREPCRITLSRKDQPVWQDYLQRAVLLVTGNADFWAAADETGAIYIWTPNGRRLNSAIVMEAQPVILTCYQSWLLCITAVGMCYVWNVKTMSSPHPPVSLAPILDAAVHSLAAHPTGAPAVTQVRLNGEGRIIVSLSNGEGYAYSPQMYCWQRLSEVWWAVSSQYWNTTDSSVSDLRTQKTNGEREKKADISAGVLPWLERNTTTETLLRGRAFFLQRLIKVLLSREGFENFESGVSIAHLENRVAAALSLGSKHEFRAYLAMYTKRLGMEGLRLKVEELLRTLIGGIVEVPMEDEDGSEQLSGANVVEGRSWLDKSNLLCGWRRDELLKDVILILGKHRDLQRTIIPYSKLLNVVGEAAGNDKDAMAIED